MTAEELIEHREQVVCGELGPDTVPWDLAELHVPDDAPWWPTVDLDAAPTEQFGTVGQFDLPIEIPTEPTLPTGRHRVARLPLSQRWAAWWAARWMVIAFLLLTNTGTGITVAIAVRFNLRPLLAVAACVVVFAGLLFVWEAQHPRRNGGAR